MGKPSKSYSRREFLKKSAQTASGFALLSSVPSLLRASAFRDSPVLIERAFYTMGTTVTIAAYGESRSHVNRAITCAFRTIQHCDNVMSLYKPESDLCRLNRSGGREPVRVDSSIIDLLRHAEHFYHLSSGAFDITIEPLMHLWGFRNERDERVSIPSDHSIEKVLKAVGIENVVVEDEHHVGFRNPQTKIDLGGIAVGYSVDAAVEVLKQEGIESAFINHSGDAYALGAPPDSDGWEIGIPNPLNTRELVSRFTLRNKAVSTSGNYEKNIRIRGEIFGHILNPHTGRPGNAANSTTLIADSSLVADALSTGLFCLDDRRQVDPVNRIPGTELIRIEGDTATPVVRHYSTY